VFAEASSVAVFGCGAIGLGVINTAALVGASRIIAIDISSDKESWAKSFGATEFVNPSALKGGQKIQDYLVEITDGGLDFTFDCTGNVGDFFQNNIRDLTKLGDSRFM
jgi:S-(hydroxymethyl)glutathione dehydrogenase / alcohol dehydrogenase